MAGGQERILRRRIRSIEATKKITRSFELIAVSQISRAQGRIAGSRPYVKAISAILAETAREASGATRLLGVPESPQNVLVLVIVADRGLAGHTTRASCGPPSASSVPGRPWARITA